MSTTLGRPRGTHSAPDRRIEKAKAAALPLVDGTPFTLEHFEAWCEEYLVQYVDRWAGEPLTFEDFQREFFESIFERTGEVPTWSSIALVVPRKNGKSTMCAALALYSLLVGEGSPEVLLAAASDKQAGRMFDTCVSFIRGHELLLRAVHLREHVGEISRIDMPGKILRMASNPNTLHGYNPSLVICDELHGWLTPSHRKAWAALTTGGGARELTQTVTITTAGGSEDRTDGILGHLIDTNEAHGECKTRGALTVSRNTEARTVVFNYSAKTTDPTNIAAMKAANPASWITEEYLGRQAQNPELATHEVLQLHGCVWAAGAKAWLPEGVFDLCADTKRVVEPGARIMVGFDGSYNNDSTALVGCTIDEPHLFVLGVWERPQGAKSWVVPRSEVTARVDEVFEAYDVVEFSCDPPGWHREIEEWSERYGSPPLLVQETNKRALMSESCSRLFTAVVNRTVTHDGNPRLAAHVANATVKETTDGAYITKEDRHSPRKIDLAIAAVLAYGRASLVETGGGFGF